MHRNLTGARAVVIGAGVAGLSAAIALSARGARVLVLERGPVPGGRLARIRLGPYRFDLGESAVTQAALFGRLFALADLRLSDFLEFQPIDPFARLIFPGGESLALWRESDRLLGEIGRFSSSDARRFAKDWRRWHQTALAAEDAFWTRPGRRWKGWADLAGAPTAWPFAAALLDPRSLRRYVHGRYRSPAVPALMAFMASRFGAFLSSAPASLRYLMILELTRGLAAPVGGMGALVDALLRVARLSRVRIVTDARVERIELDRGRPRLVAGEGFKEVRADIVISTLNPRQTLEGLFNPGESVGRALRPIRRQRPSRSALQILVGSSREWSAVDAFETVWLAPDRRETERQLDGWRVPAAQPAISVQNLSRVASDAAPDGASALRIGIPAPALSARYSWNRDNTGRMRDELLQRLEGLGMRGLEESIEQELVLSPQALEQAYDLPGGSLFGPSLRGPWGLLSRPGQACATIPGLFFAGASTHPGPTVSLAALSGMLAAEAAASAPKG